MTAGARLSYPEEDIRKGSAEEMSSYEGEGPVILLIENPDGGESAPFPGVPDEAFVRGKVPMTKEEIRCIALSKLRLGETSVVYDIGAGTGSVAVEAARMAFRGRVYAVERNPEGLKLIRENQEALRAAGLTVVSGEAPEALEGLPAPGPGIYRRKRRKAFRDPCSSTSEESARPGGDHSHFSGNGGRGEGLYGKDPAPGRGRGAGVRKPGKKSRKLSSDDRVKSSMDL